MQFISAGTTLDSNKRPKKKKKKEKKKKKKAKVRYGAQEAIFIVPFSARFWCILKAWKSRWGSWPIPFLRHS
jgi:hypothetical protein